MLSFFYKISKRLFAAQWSFSQSGEDVIVLRILSRLGIKNPSYLDIGANDPVRLNNTYLLYINGGHGVLVEPHPVIYKKLKHQRRHDKVLNVGVGTDDMEQVDFYVMSNEFLHTFDSTEAKQIAHTGKAEIEKVIKIPLFSINRLLDKHFTQCPNFISLDTEGLDERILKTFDFTKYRPEVMCLECVDFSNHINGATNLKITTFMDEHGYMAYASTHINTIFVDKKKWAARKK